MGNDLIIADVVKIIDDYTIIINKGSLNNIKKGQRILVYGLGEQIIDPATKEDLGTLEIIRGSAEASHVQDKITTLSCIDKKIINRGSKTIRKSSPYMSMFGQSNETVIEEPEVEELPFKDVQVGDKAKLIV